MSRLFIGNISHDVHPELLRRMCFDLGPVLDFQLRPDPSGRSLHKGSGYVVYSDDAAAIRARQALNGRMVSGRPLSVQTIQVDAPAPQTFGMPPGAPPTSVTASSTWAPPNVRSFLDSQSPAMTHKILSELRGQALSQPEATRNLLLQYPVLAQSVLYMMSNMGTLRSATPAYAAAAQHQQPAPQAPSSFSQQHPPAPLQQQLLPEEREQLETVRGFMSLTEAQVATLPPENRAGVQQIRLALNTPPEQLVSTGQMELLALREELLKLFNKDRGLQ